MKNAQYLRKPFAVVVAGLAAVATTAAVAIFVLDRSLQVRAIAFDWALMALAVGAVAWTLSRREEARQELQRAKAVIERPSFTDRAD